MDLEDTKKEHSKVFECFSEIVPEESKVWSLVWNRDYIKCYIQVIYTTRHIIIIALALSKLL